MEKTIVEMTSADLDLTLHYYQLMYYQRTKTTTTREHLPFYNYYDDHERTRTTFIPSSRSYVTDITTKSTCSNYAVEQAALAKSHSDEASTAEAIAT